MEALALKFSDGNKRDGKREAARAGLRAGDSWGR